MACCSRNLALQPFTEVQWVSGRGGERLKSGLGVTGTNGKTWFVTMPDQPMKQFGFGNWLSSLSLGSNNPVHLATPPWRLCGSLFWASRLLPKVRSNVFHSQTSKPPTPGMFSSRAEGKCNYICDQFAQLGAQSPDRSIYLRFRGAGSPDRKQGPASIVLANL